MTDRGGARLLASPPLGEGGGGVGQVAAMLWTAMRQAWPESAELRVLEISGAGHRRAAAKLNFGARMSAAQLGGSVRWTLFAHLGLARVQSAVPASLRAPYGVFLHGIECWSPLPARDRRMLNDASIRIANSEYTASRIRQVNPGVRDIAVCHLGLPRPLDAEPRPCEAGSPPVAIIVGRMAASERYKGHDELLDVWPEVVAAVPDARLVVVGDGDDRGRLEDRARRGPAGDRITFAGFVEARALAETYRRASLFVMPSRGEGFGLAYLEAMAYGLPCIGSIHDAAREVVADNVTGLLVDPADRGALGRAIVLLLQDRALAARWGAAGRDRVGRLFTFERFAREVTAHLRRALEPVAAPEAAERRESVL